MAMTDRERVVNRLKRLIEAAHNENYDFIYIPVGTAKLIVKMLEKQEAQKFFVDESGKITPLPVVVRCKDCVNSGTSRCPCHYSGDPYIDWNPDDNWFCADGERR